MTILLAILMAVSLSAQAQNYGAAEPSQQGEAGPGVEQPPTNEQQGLTNQTGISNFMPMRSRAAAPQQETRQASSPTPQPAKTSAPKTQQCANSSYEVISTKSGQRCSPKCASGETRDQSTGTCKKSNQMQPMMPASGGGGDDSKSSAGTGETLAKPKQEMSKFSNSIQKGECAATGGICGNTDREKKTADKYVQFQGALEPGSVMAPPNSPQSVQLLKGDLGTITSYQPRSQAQKVEAAAKKIEGAKAKVEAVQIDFSKQSAALSASYEGIKLNEAADFKGRPDKKEATTKGAKPAAPTDFKKQLGDVQAKIDALKARLEDLKAKLGKMCDASLQTAQALKEAVEKTGVADDKMMDVYQKLQTENTTGGAVEQDFRGTYPNQWNACAGQMEPAATTCKEGAASAASARKTGYNPTPTQQAAEEAVQSAKEAHSAMKTVEQKHQAALSSMKAVIASAKQVDAATMALQNQLQGMNAKQASSDSNLQKRIDAIVSAVNHTRKTIIPNMAKPLESEFVPGYRQVIDTGKEIDRLQTSGK